MIWHPFIYGVKKHTDFLLKKRPTSSLNPEVHGASWRPMEGRGGSALHSLSRARARIAQKARIDQRPINLDLGRVRLLPLPALEYRPLTDHYGLVPGHKSSEKEK